MSEWARFVDALLDKAAKEVADQLLAQQIAKQTNYALKRRYRANLKGK